MQGFGVSPQHNITSHLAQYFATLRGESCNVRKRANGAVQEVTKMLMPQSTQNNKNKDSSIEELVAVLNRKTA